MSLKRNSKPEYAMGDEVFLIERHRKSNGFWSQEEITYVRHFVVGVKYQRDNVAWPHHIYNISTVKGCRSLTSWANAKQLTTRERLVAKKLKDSV